MQISFSFEELEIQKAVRKFVKKDILPITRELDEKGIIPDAIQKKIRDMGFLKSAFPETYGGVDVSFTGLVIAFKEISYATPVPAWTIFENFMLAYPLLRYGSESLKSHYLPGLISMDSFGAMAFTESDTGSDPSQLKTVAQRCEGGWRINGAKRFITNSGICDHMMVFAKTEGDVTAFLVETAKEGYKIGKREAFDHMKVFDNGDIYLDDYFVPHDRVIGKVGQGFEILLNTEAMGKIVFCSLFAGMAERALDLSIRYAGEKTHRGKPIGHKFQMTQVKLARMMARLEAMKAYLFHICSKVDQGLDIFSDAAALKLLVAEDIKTITADAMEIHGAYGLSEEFDVAGLYRAAIGAQVVMGSLDIQRVIIARSLLARGSCT
jgi:acyl-CoA dehydrogenase